MRDWITTHTIRVLGWHGKEKYAELRTWVESIPGASFDKARSISYIDGDIYHHDIIFQTEEDKLVCKIIFGGMVA